MLKPRPMSRVLLVGNEDVKEKAIEALYTANLLHMEDYQNVDSHFSMGKPLKRGAAQSEKLLKLRSISNYLAIKDADQPVLENVTRSIRKGVFPVRPKVME